MRNPFTFLIHSVVSILRTLIGSFSWQPPTWLQHLYNFYRLRPFAYTAAIILIALLSYGAHFAINRPKPIDPEAITFHVVTPATTDYSEIPLRYATLSVVFSKSVAPIELVEKTTHAIVMEPTLEGTWTWASDQRLEFTPNKDWPIETHFKVKLDEPKALAPNIRLAEKKFEFDTAPFSGSFHSSEFYQDPEDPKNKLGVFEFHFSHPVDTTRFEQKIALTLTDATGKAFPSPQWDVRYDESKTKAYIRSTPLSIPENGGSLKLAIAAGTQSSLGGNDLVDAQTSTVSLPSLYSVRVDKAETTIVENDRFEPEQALVITFNDTLKDQEVAQSVTLWALPQQNPKLKPEEQSNPFSWSAATVDESILKLSKELKLNPKPTERAYATTHGFTFDAPAGTQLYLRIKRGLKSYGGFLLGENSISVLTVPNYPALLKFVGEGSLLSLKGERRVTIAVRNMPGMRLEVARVLPNQLQHLVKYNSGDYQTPELNYELSQDSLTERFEKQIDLPELDPAKTHYEGVDLSDFFDADKHGIFILKLYRNDPNTSAQENDVDTEETYTSIEDEEGEYSEEEYDQESYQEPLDTRLVVLTDLGVVSKRALDDTQTIFVQSLHAGTSVDGAQVSIIARNGEHLVDTTTDPTGSAQIPSLKGFKREKEPVMLAVSLGQDFSFFPLNDYKRNLDFSRFAIDGEVNARDDGALKSYLFSDRGLYRPGETFHVGMIVRAADWSRSLIGVPLEVDITDPRGTLAKREKISLGPNGFESISHTPSESAPTGSWDITLYLIGNHDKRSSLGNTTVQVRDFQPDRLRVRAQLSAQPAEGWVKPEDLKALIKVENLFGTPAQDRRVTGIMQLQPAFPSFSQYKQYQFYDPQRAKEGYTDELTATQTNANGDAEFALDLSKYDRATYQLRFLTQAFEAGAGRGVAAETGVLVSSNPFLVGMKSSDSLSYLKRGTEHHIDLIALGPNAKPIATEGLKSVIVEEHYVSILTKQDSGVYKYVSQLRKDIRKMEPLSISDQGQSITLPTKKPGQFVLEIRDQNDTVLNQMPYQVTGAANLTRSLDRNAELQLTLSKNDYKPGEEIEISIRAPYVGSGLITIERERVYAHRWFKTDTSSSVQTITVPSELEGNAYINVQFIRDANSDEVFMSPLSYGVVPFSIDRSARKQVFALKTPNLVKPGDTARFNISSEHPTRVAVFAVDEGILQVARYKLNDPLDHFFRKKMLQVSTSQILDLILPEFSKLAGMAAPGGDGDGGLSKHLNPFKRKGEKPAVYWSGLTDIEGNRDFEFKIPDSFNGKLRVMAVAVSANQVGIAQDQTTVRGDFVLSPNVPTQIAPGDEFEVSVGVANTTTGTSTETLPIQVELQLPSALKMVNEAIQTLSLARGNEGTVKFRILAGEQLGSIPLRFNARSGKLNAQRQIDVSLRPNVVYRQDVQTGNTQKIAKITGLRSMYDQFAKRRAAASVSPLVVADGLTAYLVDYPHYCTEQLLSQAIPALVFANRPEFGTIAESKTGDRFEGILRVLRERQSSSGGFGLWNATPEPHIFASVYASLYLLEAHERGQAVPADLMSSTNEFLTRLAGDAARNSLSGFRERAMATYLLTRQGQVTTPLLSALQEQVDRDQPKQYRDDATALFLAASYQLLKQEKAGRELLNAPLKRLSNLRQANEWTGYSDYYDEAIASAWTVYIVARHFPSLRHQINDDALKNMLAPIQSGQFNTLSSALTTLAMEAVAISDPNALELPKLAFMRDTNPNEPIYFGSAQGLIQRGDFPSDAKQILIDNEQNQRTAWYSISQSGFDKKAPNATQNKGLEIVRDYLDAQGNALTQVQLGNEVTVRLRLRALERESRGDIAVVDLLPGGFELVMQDVPPAADSGAASEQDDESDTEESTEKTPAPSLALPESSLYTQHIDIREDRVVLYAEAESSVKEFRYRIKANNVGRYVIPSAYAESMYEREIFAQGAASGSLTVTPAMPSTPTSNKN